MAGAVGRHGTISIDKHLLSGTPQINQRPKDRKKTERRYAADTKKMLQLTGMAIGIHQPSHRHFANGQTGRDDPAQQLETVVEKQPGRNT
jgi:hypothetical protein